MPIPSEKVPYSIPSMAEIRAVPKTAGRVVSTFSGCGGSCLGFEMAGFEILWASEFIDSAREVYELNHPGVPVDGRDIREVDPAEILEVAGVEAGEVDVLEGSPPCASFSTAGKRDEHWGEVKPYSEKRQRTDDLFFEYARLVEAIQPKVFVAENVAGLVKGVAKGYFIEIRDRLRECGYRVGASVVDAQWLGVPQVRKRLILVGVRDDLDVEPAFPRPWPFRYALRDALPHAVAQGDNGGFGGGAMQPASKPSPTIGAGTSSGNGRFPPSLVEVRKVNNKDVVGENVAASMEGYAVGSEWERLKPGEQSDRFFNLVRPDEREPCPTVTASGGSSMAYGGAPGGIASVAHPTEKRKFTLGELRRICGFPADFQLTGSYAQQWERLGRAVPPPMMRAIAETVRDEILVASPVGS